MSKSKGRLYKQLCIHAFLITFGMVWYVRTYFILPILYFHYFYYSIHFRFFFLVKNMEHQNQDSLKSFPRVLSFFFWFSRNVLKQKLFLNFLCDIYLIGSSIPCHFKKTYDRRLVIFYHICCPIKN